MLADGQVADVFLIHVHRKRIHLVGVVAKGEESSEGRIHPPNVHNDELIIDPQDARQRRMVGIRDH